MGALFSNAGPPPLTRAEKWVEARIVKIEKDTEAGCSVSMDIQDQPIRDDGLGKLAEYLEKEFCKIDKVILRKNDTSSKGIGRLAKSLYYNKTVRELTIVDNKMGDQLPKGKTAIEETMNHGAVLIYGAAAATKLAEALSSNRTLVVLKLESNCLGNEGCEAIAQSLKDNTTLTDLILQKNEIGNKGINALAQILAANSTLTRLDLQENLITDEGGNALCAALSKNTVLTEVNLRANLLTHKVCDHLASMLSSNHSLIELNLRRNSLKDEGCSKLAKALEDNGSIKRLFLSSNLIGDSGCAKLAESLSRNNALEEIYLEINNIEDHGCVRLAEALEKNACLKKVDLQMNNFGGPSYARLAEAVDKNSTLQQLVLSNSLIASKEPVKHIGSVLRSRWFGEDKEDSEQAPAMEAVDRADVAAATGPESLNCNVFA